MEQFIKRGYVVKETGPVYYTKDIDATVKWFTDVMGWYYEVDERDAEGNGLYGCVFDLPNAFEGLHIAPFTGIHLFHGEPQKGVVVAFMKIQGLEELRKFVTERGWAGISPIERLPWGKLCSVTTTDGCVLRFFE